MQKKPEHNLYIIEDEHNQPDNQSPYRRSSTRYSIKSLHCELGQIIDISTDGMRVESKGKLCPIIEQQTGILTLSHQATELRLESQARWIKRRGLFKHEVGLMFMNHTTQQKQNLDHLARFGFTPQSSTTPYISPKPIHASFEFPNYYRILDLSKNANTAQIQRAYDKLIQIYASQTSNPDTESKLKKIHEAYKLLIDDQLRAVYHQMLIEQTA
ncbi:Chaperone protein DnaJ [Poriferisphaera corsica]|uniref:Chaperone protein DnaJ n=1 Tax=Poriferisphaera corsica TaxID=2528020 RepID=A0A517YTT9_9BACT|nr:DnaJ domain-containing protein [Poriferisphaera corsica]QDU33592.1 Chaperone protein DnaJ [Poriferisphaera corsica]